MSVATVADFVESLRGLPLLTPEQLGQLSALQQQFSTLKLLAHELVSRGWLTRYQAEQLAQGEGEGLVFDQYVLLDLLGHGGMGTVYQARQTRLDRLVALKVLRAETLIAADALERFEREARSAARLAHPNVVTVFDSNTAHGRAFIVMEFIEGKDLNALIKEQGPLPIPTACGYLRQAALGLQHAHEQGLVHRDVKPHNLMLTKQGIIKVMDLGLARAVGTVGAKRLTTAGAVMGTPNYMAPEQTLDAGTVDIRADVYALGCTLYHLLAGVPPFADLDLAHVLAAQRSREPKALSDIRPEAPPELSVVLCRLMAKRPDERYQTPAEVAAALVPFVNGTSPTSAMAVMGNLETLAKQPANYGLDAFSTAVSGLPGPAPHTGDTTIVRKPVGAARRRRRAAVLVAAALLATGAVLAVLQSRSSEAPKAEPTQAAEVKPPIEPTKSDPESHASETGEVYDGGDFLSPVAIKEANAIIRDIFEKYNQAVVVETFATIPKERADQFNALRRDKLPLDGFFYAWATNRYFARKRPAVYILISRIPSPYLIESLYNPSLLKKEFKNEDRRVMGSLLRNEFALANAAGADKRQQYFDRGLIAACTYVRTALQTNGAKKSE